ncbi:hypothetical protein L3556_06330 [Candidatus Synechococcus calcipolaris G9]|uniref:DNA-binding protein n=1 Tax=Candidatus Synechococcus calcipolaris G9 TaxID=1497997 RepID=A0ABT6EXL6_9SYNE|nr:hypothetical protein [Candidatus Synechococcus calcipolaris]MDG2990552.1 hypothetical protein [Candidatus Synechococcus calcipolaris G9]
MPKKRSARNSSEWVSTGVAAKYLGVQPKKLLSLLPDLRPGHHWINISGSQAKRACYRWQLKNLLAYFSQIH